MLTECLLLSLIGGAVGARSREQVARSGRVSRECIEGKTRDLRDRAQGVVAEMRSLGRRTGDTESTLQPTAHGAGSLSTP